jgi:hypothetical protein
MGAHAGFTNCRPGLTACTLCMATRMRPVCLPFLDACIGFLGCMNALAGFLCVSCRLGLTACTLWMATWRRPGRFPFLDACAPPGLHVLLVLLAAWAPLMASCALLVGWLDCIDALHGYMYAATLLSMLRLMCACQAAYIGPLGCMNALAGFFCASSRLGLTACTLCTVHGCMYAACLFFMLRIHVRLPGCMY